MNLNGELRRPGLRTAHVLYFAAFKITLAISFQMSRTCAPTSRHSLPRRRHGKNGGFPRRLFLFPEGRDQRSSCSTLCCDWLASASAETAIDWRVDSAWLLAASSFGSATVRFEAPVCSTLIRFLLKSWRISTIDRFEPRLDAAVRSVVLAWLSCVRIELAELLSRKSIARVQVRQTEAGVVEDVALDRQLRRAGFIEGQVEGIAVQQVDAVERGVLRRGVDLRQNLVVLRHQACAGRLRVRIGDRSGRSQARERLPACRAVPVIAPIVDEAALLVVVMLI